VVSTDLPAARWLLADAVDAGIDPDGLLSVLPGRPAEFAAAVATVAAAAAAGGPQTADLMARRRAYAARHSWPRRADAFAQAIGLPLADPAALATAPMEVP
jgi:hypothetical protein